MDLLLALGAAELYVTSRAPAAPLEEGPRAGCHLVHARDILWMERELEPPLGAGGLALEPLDRARGGAWLALHNACFFDMPNSATYGPRDLDRALSTGHDCGFALWRGALAGVYELDLTGALAQYMDEALGLPGLIAIDSLTVSVTLGDYGSAVPATPPAEL